MPEYGIPPEKMALFDDVAIDEFMHYLYLPVCMPDEKGCRLPERLECIRDIVEGAMVYEVALGGDLSDKFVYVSVRRGWATDDNPLNRPGWHCDGFGTTDTNYVWWLGSGTRFAVQDFKDIEPDHQTSMDQFEYQILSENIEWDLPEAWLYRLDPYVVHATPRIDPPGEMRSFVKVSISPERYNLYGNSHNHLFDYAWEMHDRSLVRNDPAYPEADFIRD